MVKVINIDTKTRTIRVENAADGDIKTWRTTESGAHFPIKKGESTKEALDKFVEKKRPEATPKTAGQLKKAAAKLESDPAYHYERADRLSEMIKQREKELDSPNLTPTAKKAIERGIGDLQLAISKHWDAAGKLEKAQKKQKPAKPRWDGNKKTPYKDAPTLYEFLKKNDYTYPDMDKYKSYTWEQFLDDAHKGTVPKPFAKADTAQVDKLYDYAFHKTGKNQDEFADWVKKSVTWHGDSNKEDGKTQQPKKESGSESFKSAMQTTMKAFPRLYDFEKPHLEEFANKVYEDIQNNPGKEKEVLEHLADAYKRHIAGLGPWVDTPTLAKKAFLDQMLESHLSKQPKQSSQPTSYDLDDAFDEADLGSEWGRAKHRMDFHGVSEYTIKDIIDSGKYEAGDIIEALESSSHDKIDEMRKSLKK